MKTININFVGFWPEFDKKNNFIYNKLKMRYDVKIVDNPDYLFSSCFSNEYLNYDCIKIFYTGENLSPDFNCFDYAIGYDYLEFEDRYFRLPNFFIEESYKTDVEEMQKKHLNNVRVLESKKKFCSFVVSKGNGYVAKEREIFFRELCKYKKVNSGGRFLNNIGQPNGVENKYLFQKEHKFAIAFENVSHSGYTTEKLVQAFAARTIPIYWGDPQVTNVFNEKAFIDCNKYGSWDEIIERVVELDNNDDEYIKMLNEPALLDEEYICMQDKEFEKFLYNIFEQSYEQAYRRDRIGYGKVHCDRLIVFDKIRKNMIYRILKRMRVVKDDLWY